MSGSGDERRARVTIADVAAAAGVSRGTVSRVMNGEAYVSDRARVAVEDAAARVGYVANKAARDLAAGKSRAVAVIVDEARTRLTGDPNTSVLLLSLQAGLSAHRYRAVTVLLGAGDDDRSAAQFLRSGSVDGVILLSDEQCPRVLEAIEDTGLPAVLMCEPTRSRGPVSVSIDDESAARDITSVLVAAERRRIAMIAVGLNTGYGRARVRGYKSALGHGFDPALVVEAAGVTYEAGQRAMEVLLKRNPGVDGIFVASDVVAAGGMQTLLDKGHRIPEDISVVGFDGNEWSERSKPALTTVRQPLADLAREAISALLGLLTGAPVASVRLPARTLHREST